MRATYGIRDQEMSRVHLSAVQYLPLLFQVLRGFQVILWTHLFGLIAQKLFRSLPAPQFKVFKVAPLSGRPLAAVSGTAFWRFNFFTLMAGENVNAEYCASLWFYFFNGIRLVSPNLVRYRRWFIHVDTSRMYTSRTWPSMATWRTNLSNLVPTFTCFSHLHETQYPNEVDTNIKSCPLSSLID